MIITSQDMSRRIDELHEAPPASCCICSRCGGLMVSEFSIDLWSPTSKLDGAPRRCVQCGDVIDAVILRNRRIGLVSNSLPSTATPASSLGPQAAA